MKVKSEPQHNRMNHELRPHKLSSRNSLCRIVLIFFRR